MSARSDSGRHAAPIFGIPLIGSAFCPPGQVIKADGRIYYHCHVARIGRKRRPHGRTNGPRRWKWTARVHEDPFMDLMREKARAEGGSVAPA